MFVGLVVLLGGWIVCWLVCLLVVWFVDLFVGLWVWMFVCLIACLFFCLSICLFVGLVLFVFSSFVCLSVGRFLDCLVSWCVCLYDVFFLSVCCWACWTFRGSAGLSFCALLHHRH